MARPEDWLPIILPAPAGSPEPERRRWWRIRQPPPVVAFSLQARIAAALGEVGGFAVEALFTDPDQAEDLHALDGLVGEALALRVLRRSRAGMPIAAMGEDMREATARLWAVLRAASTRARGGLDALLLVGAAEREAKAPGYRWGQPSLLHALLMFSELQFDGEDPKGPRTVPVDLAKLGDKEPAEVRLAGQLRQNVIDGSLTAFVRTLDDLLASPDELALLSTWAVLHLFRPF
ncbi:MAG TPA: hypothetical protein VIK91_13700 [Nannocystis sp.]